MSNSLFQRCDGTAISINGYARDTTVDANEFVWMGEGGVASWGKTQGVDATAMQVPLGTRMTGNLCHEIGHYEKQVSCYFEAVSGEAYIADNIMCKWRRFARQAQRARRAQRAQRAQQARAHARAPLA